MSLSVKNRFDPSFALTDKGDKPSQLFRDYMVKLDAVVGALAAGVLPNNLVNAANDAAAAVAGVPIQGMYRNGSVLMVRVV